MALSHFRMLNDELLKKNTYVFPEQEPLIIFYSKSDVCMEKNGKNTKQTIHISIRMHFLRNGEECNLYNTVWC